MICVVISDDCILPFSHIAWQGQERSTFTRIAFQQQYAYYIDHSDHFCSLVQGRWCLKMIPTSSSLKVTWASRHRLLETHFSVNWPLETNRHLWWLVRRLHNITSDSSRSKTNCSRDLHLFAFISFSFSFCQRCSILDSIICGFARERKQDR